MNDDQNQEIEMVPETELTHKQLFQMASDTQEDDEEPETEESEVTETSVTITQANAFNRIGARTSIVVVFTTLGVAGFGVMGHNLTTIFSNSNQQQSQKVANQPKINPRKDNTKDIAVNQKAQLEKLNSQILASAKPAPTTKPVVIPTVPPPAVKPTAKPKIVYVDRVVRVTVPAVPDSKYERTQQIPQPKTQVISTKPTIVVPTPNRPTTNSPTQTMKAKPPARSIEIASSTTNNSSSINQNKSSNKGRTKQSITEILSSLPVNEDSQKQILIVGSRTTAKLENAIVWTGKDSDSHSSFVSAGDKSHKTIQTYPIKLKEALKNPDGTEALPKDTLLIAQIKSVTAQGWVNLAVVAIVTPTINGAIEKPVPIGTILVQKKDGSPLKADVKTTTQSANLNNTNAPISISRTSRLPVRHGIDPIHNESARRANTNLQSNSKIMPPVLQIRSYTLEKGALVQIYVNRSFSL